MAALLLASFKAAAMAAADNPGAAVILGIVIFFGAIALLFAFGIFTIKGKSKNSR